MNRADRREAAKVAARPPARTVDVVIDDGLFAGWAATARADFPARLLVDIDSGRAGPVVTAMETIILTHNMPGADGKLARSIGDVEPYDGLLAIAGAVLEAIGKLPNR